MLRKKFDFVLILLTTLVLTTTCARAPKTGRLQFIMVGDSTMNQLGADAYQEILADEKVSNDPRLTRILDRVGARLAKVSNQPGFEWEFKVIDNPEMVNAFCLPGGKVAVYTGILPIADTEAGLAVVVGHVSQPNFIRLTLVSSTVWQENSDCGAYSQARHYGIMVFIVL